MFSYHLNLIKKIINNALPSYQAISTKDANLGFGFIFYSFVRAIRPKKIIIIGSKAGFSVINFALGLKDNNGTIIKRVECYNTKLHSKQKGIIYFIDPSFSCKRKDKNHWYGIGFWDNKNAVINHWKKFGVEKYIKHYKMTSQNFLKQKDCLDNSIDMLYIDGDHSYKGIMHDFCRYYSKIKRNGIIMAHDVAPELKKDFPKTGGYEALNSLDKQKYEIFRLPVYPGLAIIRKK